MIAFASWRWLEIGSARSTGPVAREAVQLAAAVRRGSTLVNCDVVPSCPERPCKLWPPRLIADSFVLRTWAKLGERGPPSDAHEGLRYTRQVSGLSKPRVVTGRVIRPGQAQPPDDDWRQLSRAERISLVWELTRLCAHWRMSDDELRLQRTVGRVQRPRG